MRRSILVVVALLACAFMALGQGGGAAAGARGGRGGAPVPPPSGPIADLTNSIVEAYNKQDNGFFEKIISADALWLDEDGHFIGNARGFLTRQLSATPKRNLTISNLRVGSFGEAGWSAFSYVIDDGVAQRKGTSSILFRKTGNDWQAVLMHGAINAPAIAPH